MSYPWSTVCAMTVGYLFSGVITHLPVLAVLIAGLVLVSARGARLGARSTMLARFGLGVLLAGQILDVVWFMMLPQIIASTDYASRSYGIMSLVVGIMLALLIAAGLGLLIAALVTRAPAGPGGPFEAASGPFRPGNPPEGSAAGFPAQGQAWPAQGQAWPAQGQPGSAQGQAWSAPASSPFDPPAPPPTAPFPGASPPRASGPPAGR